jgi:HK97 family phage major capsid protein
MPENTLRDRARQTMTEARSILEQHNGSDEPLPPEIAARVDALINQGREEWQAYEAALVERERRHHLDDLEGAWQTSAARAADGWADPNATGGDFATATAAGTEQAALYRKAFETYVHRGEQAVLAMGAPYIKALTEGTDSEGGHLVPSDWQQQVLRGASAQTGLRSHVTTVPTSRDAVEWPTIEGADDIHASAVRRTWVDEQPAEGAADTEPTFGAIRIPLHTAMLTTKASRNLVEDSAVPFTDILAGLFADEVRLSDEQSFLTGDGVGKPLGLLNTTGVPTVNSGSASSVTADGLLDLFYDLPAQYRSNAIFVMSSATEATVRKLKDGNSQYLWVGGFAGAPETLLGRPSLSSEFLPAIAAAATPIVFGDFRRYVVADRVGFSIQRIDGDQQLAEKNQIGFVGRQRVGGRVVQARAFRLQKISS